MGLEMTREGLKDVVYKYVRQNGPIAMDSLQIEVCAEHPNESHERVWSAAMSMVNNKLYFTTNFRLSAKSEKDNRLRRVECGEMFRYYDTLYVVKKPEGIEEREIHNLAILLTLVGSGDVQVVKYKYIS